MRSFFERGLGSPFTTGRGLHTPLPSDSTNFYLLDPNKMKVIVVPAGAQVVSFATDGDFFIAYGTSAAVTVAAPQADITDGTAPDYNPSMRRIPAGTTHIAVIAPGGASLFASFYAE